MIASFLACGCRASAAPGVLALDEQAIAAKAPAQVYLDTIVVAGARLVAAGEHGVIIYSDDSGITWQQSQVPADTTLTALAFPSPADGWAVGNYGVILHTRDGGKTWTRQLDGTQIGALTLAAAQDAVAKGNNAPAVPNALRRAEIFVKQGPDKPFLSVLAISPTKIFVFGAYRLAMETDTGGERWQDWSLHIDDPLSHHIYGAAEINANLYLTSEAGLVFKSDDGGNRFHALSGLPDATFFGVTGTGDSVLIYGVAGEAYKSTDDGGSWVPVKFDSSSNLMAATELKSGAILIAAESGRLLTSADKGTSFIPSPVVVPMLLAGVVQAPDGSIVVVGNRGVMRVPLRELTQADQEPR